MNQIPINSMVRNSVFTRYCILSTEIYSVQLVLHSRFQRTFWFDVLRRPILPESSLRSVFEVRWHMLLDYLFGNGCIPYIEDGHSSLRNKLKVRKSWGCNGLRPFLSMARTFHKRYIWRSPNHLTPGTEYIPRKSSKDCF